MFDYSINTINKTLLDWVPAPLDIPNVVILAFFGISSVLFFSNLVHSIFWGIDAPVVGHRSILEPAGLVRLRFALKGPSMIQAGRESDPALKFKDSMFRVRRIGSDILIVSPKYVDEIRKLSKDNTRSIEPFIHDFAGEYTKGLVFLESDLQNRVIQQKLTPNLGSLTSVMKAELDIAFRKEIPDCQDEWIKVDINDILVRVIARISARIFLGPEEGRNEEWLTTTASYTKNLFITGFILRPFPRLLRPLVALMLPTYHRLHADVASARRIVARVVSSRQAAEAQRSAEQEKSTDILQWLMDEATGDEKKVENLSQRILILSLASIHTTALTMTQALYDLCASPEYLEPLRDELNDVLIKHGGWQKTTLNYLLKLDSTLKESQRLHPVFLLTFNRIFHQPMTLSNGTHLPAGTRVAAPSHSMLQDPANVPGLTEPSKFDPFRYSRIREDAAHPENAQRFLFAMTDPRNMAFGYGKYACPGRFYASNEMKLVLAHLLLRYDIKLPDGSTRPKNFTFDSDMFPDPRGRLLIKRRDISDPTISDLVGL
ncbi:hypothetical protein F66182_3362 [Fusarium sp. NRRL 66182]|nr:hypothetical protein F66182_3362 [Fusarium sp. NRRL 66182]